MKVVKFTQDVCPKCEVLEAVLENLEDAQVDEVIVLTEDNKAELVEKHDIMGTPLMIMFDDNGEEIARTSAYNQVGTLMDFFDKLEN